MVYDHMYLTWSTYSNLLYSRQHIWTDPLHLRRRASDTIYNMSVVRSVGPYPASLPQQPMEQWRKVKPVDNRLLRLPYAYHWHAIGTFNTCSRGAIKWSLIDTGGGYNLACAGLPCTHSPTFPTSCPHFSLVAPSGLQFNQVPAIKPKCWVKHPMAVTWSFDHSTFSRSLHLRLTIANGLSLVMGSQG
jgi:hypothetical protein